MWIGGLVSAGVLVFAVFSCYFANAFLNQYPIEEVGESAFACDTTMRNAQFSSSMQMLKPRHPVETQPIFDLLNRQPFTLHIDLINTAFTCADQILVQRIVAYTLIPLSVSSCVMSYDQGILSLAVPLPSHDMNIQVTLPGLRTVGALRLGLSGPGATHQDRR